MTKHVLPVPETSTYQTPSHVYEQLYVSLFTVHFTSEIDLHLPIKQNQNEYII